MNADLAQWLAYIAIIVPALIGVLTIIAAVFHSFGREVPILTKIIDWLTRIMQMLQAVQPRAQRRAILAERARLNK